MPRHWKVFYLTTVVFICSGGEYFELYSYSSWNLCSLVIYVHISSIFGLGVELVSVGFHICSSVYPCTDCCILKWAQLNTSTE